jgi:hypothetical protein
MDEKIKDQKSLLVKLRKEFAEESDPSGETWTEYEIQQLLKKIPIAMYNQGDKVVQAMIELKMAKQNIRKIFTTKVLEANYDADLKSATERKAWAENSPEYLKAEEEQIIAEGNYKAAELHLAAYDNLFTAVKKASSLVELQNRAQFRSQQ